MPEVTIAGVQFHYEERGAGDAVFLLHGFTGSFDTWTEVGPALAEDFRVIAVDLIGHGSSDAPVDSESYDFSRAVANLAAMAIQLHAAPAIWLGYSMGGRLALGLAVDQPEVARALILESASPGIASPQERLDRQRADDMLAKWIEREGVEKFVDKWERLPMWESQARLDPAIQDRQRAVRLANRPAGLAGCLRGMGIGVQPSYWDELDKIALPVLLVAGALDRKFTQIAHQMQGALPTSCLQIVPDAGHAVHLEQPHEFNRITWQFLLSHVG